MSEDSIEESKGLECSIYQNYTASEVFIQGLAGIVNQQDIASIVIAQKKMLQRFEKTNEMLANCNSLSMTRYEKSLKDFKNHTKLVTDMRKDLDSIFKRIKVIKSKMVIRYPEAVKASGYDPEKMDKEEDDEYDVVIRKMKDIKSTVPESFQQSGDLHLPIQ
ncbi:kxDL motif-containing protein CG10681 isoform X2 [Lepeophtheirus salmonis]|nr:kxDL motif-containing protein CG10681-like isoform X3 [Lepeophtheirus salmonis]